MSSKTPKSVSDWLAFDDTRTAYMAASPKQKAEVVRYLGGVLALLRAQALSYQTSHWQVRGDDYYGNHLMFERLYGSVGEEIDTLAEKIVGYVGIEGVALPDQMEKIHMLCGAWGRIECHHRRGIQSETDLQKALKIAYDSIKETGLMTLGLDDFLMATASSHESNQYLLQQALASRPKKAASPRKAAIPKKYEHIDFKPPKGVADAAAKGLEMRQKASPSNKGGLTSEEAGKQGIGSGVQRAVNLKNRDTISPEVIKQMRGFLSRSEKSSEISAENKSTPWNDKGYVAWLLWGGDPAKAWVDKIIGQMEAADEKEKRSKQAVLEGSSLGPERNTIKRAFQGDRVFRSPKPFEGFRDVSQTNKATTRKPEGLWYSCGTDWEDWCSGGPSQGSGWGENHLKKSPYRYGVEINRSRMLFIHSKRDFKRFVRYFGEKDEYGYPGQAINWAAVAKEYDGIEICPYIPSFKYEYSWYQGWDVASGCIWGSGAFRSVVPAEDYCGIKTASENEPTNPGLWAKVQALAKGEQASMTHGGKTINGPNDGKGFTVFLSAYANGWANKVYKDLGGGWKKKAGGA